MSEVELQEVVSFLDSLRNESDVSKKFKVKAEKVINILESEHQLAIEKALLELEEFNSHDMPTYFRTQVWDLISMLESMKA